MKANTVIFLALMLVILVTSSCTQNSFQIFLNSQRTLRIATLYKDGNRDELFRKQYTDAFQVLNPDIKIEVIHALDATNVLSKQQIDNECSALKKIMEGPNAVDVIITDGHLTKELIQENKLKQLDSYIEQQNFNVGEIAPATLNFMKLLGDGKIYGLVPTFNSKAIYYNKKIFDEAEVEYPKDGMTWEDLFQLASRVANKKDGEDRVFGFQFYRAEGPLTPFAALLSCARPLGLKICDEKLEKMYVNTPEWNQVWTIISNFYLNKVSWLPKEKNDSQLNIKLNDFIVTDNFFAGKVAMMHAEYSYSKELINAMKHSSKDLPIHPFEWDVVTPPVQPSKPQESDSVKISNIFSINANANNAKDAWKYIQFINGEQWVHIRTRSELEITSCLKKIKLANDLKINTKAFTTLSPVEIPDTDFQFLTQKHEDLFKIQDLGTEKFDAVISGKLSVDDALDQFQNQGTKLLEKIRKNSSNE